MAFTIKQGDTSPALLADLETPSREPAQLVGATVLFHMRSSRPNAQPLVAPVVVVDAELGRVRYDWQPEDTAVSGDFEAEFEVTYADGSIETFPNEGYIEIFIPEQIA